MKKQNPSLLYADEDGGAINSNHIQNTQREDFQNKQHNKIIKDIDGKQLYTTANGTL